MKALIVTPIPAVETIGGGTWGILQLQVGFQIEVNMYFPATVDSKPHNSGICSAALGIFPRFSLALLFKSRFDSLISRWITEARCRHSTSIP